MYLEARRNRSKKFQKKLTTKIYLGSNMTKIAIIIWKKKTKLLKKLIPVLRKKL